jgi:hypothetical protein
MQEDVGGAEVIASMVNRTSLPTKSQPTTEQTTSPTKTGIITTIMAVGSRVGSMFSAAPKSPMAGAESNTSRKRAADDPPSAERGEKRLRTNAEAGHKTLLPRPSIISARLPGYVPSDDHSVKRASGRGDPYDVPDEEPKDFPEPPAKQGRTRGQKGAKESKRPPTQTAKKAPLKVRQTRKGQPQVEVEEQEGDGEKEDEVEHVPRQTRALSRQVEAKRLGNNPDTTSSPKAALIENSLPQGKRRNPGRPRKENPPKPANGEENRILAAEDSHHSREGLHHLGDASGTSSPRFTRQEKAKKNARSASATNKLAMRSSLSSARSHGHEEGNPPEDEEDVHDLRGEEGSSVDQPTITIGGTEGLESIQVDLSKSPTKSTPHFPPAQKTATENPTKNLTVNGPSLEDRNQDSDQDTNSDEEEEEERDSEATSSQPVAITLGRRPFTKVRLDKMRNACDSMGTNQNGKAFGQTVVPFTQPGKSVLRASKKLSKLYKCVQKIKSGESPDRGGLQENLDQISNTVAVMQEHVTTIVNDQLGTPEQGGGEEAEESTKTVMKDVYFHVLPALVEALDAAVDALEQADQISEPDIEALMIFVRMMSSITIAASIDRNKKCRPEKTGFRIAKPFNIISRIVGDINVDYRMVKAEKKKAARKERKRRHQAHEETLRREAEGRKEDDERLEREAKQVRLHEEFLEQQRQKIKAKKIEQEKAKEKERRDALESLEDMNTMLAERGLPPLELSLSQLQASQRFSQAQMSALSQGPTPSQDGEEQEIPEGGWTITEKRIRLEKEAKALKEEAERVAEAAQEAERQLRKLKQEEERVLNGSQGDEPERILVFGVNNVHSKPKKPMMSATEIMTFIELLKVNLGR